MRIRSIETKGIGGLHEGRVEFPDAPIVAIAGPNGTGKSKLLTCLIGPWLGSLPTPDKDEEASVWLTLKLNDEETAALETLSDSGGWGKAQVGPEVDLGLAHKPMVGYAHLAQENGAAVLSHFPRQAEFIQRFKSLDPLFIPAERRLLSPRNEGINLQDLSDEIASKQVTESRTAAIRNFGRLDDQEFESFAKALCIARALESSEDGPTARPPALNWESFVKSVNELISPKELLPLTQEVPDQLRIKTPDGSVHSVQELSSGERQALIVLSRVLRAGGLNRVVIVDEPDAFLHPHLGERLIEALGKGITKDGQLIVATHSPAILDSIPPSSIVRLSHAAEPQLVETEDERISLYRGAGFKASALTQSDLLLLTEGESVAGLLSLLFPQLSQASIRDRGGRDRVVQGVESLLPLGTPVLGVVDGDADPDAKPIPNNVESFVTVWPKADIEAMFLSSDAALEVLMDLGLAKKGFESVANLRDCLEELVTALQDNVIAELAQIELRRKNSAEWPSPKGEIPIDRLREAVSRFENLKAEDVESAIANAQKRVMEADDIWTIVRGKYVLNDFARKATHVPSGQALLETIAKQRPLIPAFDALEQAVDQALAQ